jgi:hypothetical protein
MNLQAGTTGAHVLCGASLESSSVYANSLLPSDAGCAFTHHVSFGGACIDTSMTFSRASGTGGGIVMGRRRFLAARLMILTSKVSSSGRCRCPFLESALYPAFDAGQPPVHSVQPPVHSADVTAQTVEHVPAYNQARHAKAQDRHTDAKYGPEFGAHTPSLLSLLQLQHL